MIDINLLPSRQQVVLFLARFTAVDADLITYSLKLGLPTIVVITKWVGKHQNDNLRS